MKINKALLLALSSLCLAGCQGNKSNEKTNETEASKTLVLYYSQTGVTKQVAEEIQRQLNAEIDSIVPVESYGYDYDATIQRWKKEMEDSIKVPIKTLSRNINDFDTIFLGFPIWGGNYASPVASWLTDNKLEGKTIITFSTFGSGGIEGATKSVAKEQPTSKVIEGYGVREARIASAPSEVKEWLIDKGYKAGEKIQLPEYGDVTAISPETLEIFDKACGDYKFPLGTPVDVSSRKHNDITDYRYDVISKSPDGKESKSVIYVTVKGDEKPEFTRVVREG